MNKVKSWLQENLKGDPILWGIVIAFALISILVVYSATGTLAYRKGDGNTERYLIKHTALIFIGLAFMWFAHKINYRYYSRLSLIGLILSVPLLLFAWKFGATVNEASRWIVIPVIKQTFQPSDLAKLSLITYLASMLSKRQLNIDNIKDTLVPIHEIYYDAYRGGGHRRLYRHACRPADEYRYQPGRELHGYQ